jgi:hypothetical protein
MWKKIFAIGVADHLPSYIQAKIRLTNQLLVFVVLACTTISATTGGTLALFSGAAVLVAFGIYGLNHLGWHQLGRATIVLMGTFIATVPALLATPAGELPPPAAFTLALGLCATIFALFDYRERAPIYALLALNVVWSMSIPYLTGLFPKTLDYQTYIAFDKQMLRIFFSFCFTVGSMLLLQRALWRTEKENNQILADLTNQKAGMGTQRRDLEATLAQLTEAKARDEKRNWTNEQLGQWANLLRQDRDLAQHYPSLLTFLVKTVQANQGGLYVAEADETGASVLDLKACYAWDRQKFHRQRVPVTVGLLGQVYQEKASLWLEKVPADYVQIVSSLGQATPTVLGLLPLIHRDRVEGVLELASFRPLSAHERDFIERAAEGLAATIADYRNRAQSEHQQAQTEHQRAQLLAREEQVRQQVAELETELAKARAKEQTHLRRIAELEGKLAAVPVVEG